MTNSVINQAVGAINNSARVADISGDQMGVLGKEPFHVVTNPGEVARAVLQALEAYADEQQCSIESVVYEALGRFPDKPLEE